MENFSKKKKITRTILCLFAVVAFCVAVFLLLKFSGLWEEINSVDKIKNFILSFGVYGKIVFVLIQFLQVTFLPIPSTIVTIAGSVIYGGWQAFLLSLGGILLGSVVAFLLGQKLGKKIVCFMIGKDACKKWTKKLTRAKYSFFVMMLLPFFPDDVLCLVAGLTDMSWDYFMLVNFVSRPIGIALTCFFGSGEIIPYNTTWGIVVWVVIIVCILLILFLATKYEDKIDKFFLRKLKKK